MNDSTFLAQFYGPTLTWFAPIFGTVGLLAVLGNALMIWIALSTPSIRSVSSNWFIINMGVSDLLFGLNSSFLCGTAFICGGNGSCPMLAKICGGLADMTVITAMVFPTFVLVDRYLSVTTLPNETSGLRKFFISTKGRFSITISSWIFVIVLCSILASFDALGEDFLGFYGTKPFTSFGLYLIYMIAGSYGVSSYFVTFYFYGKLQKFVKENVKNDRENRSTRQHQRKENKETRAVMKMVKLSTLIPLITQSIAFVLNGGQWFIPHDLIPMWCRRIIVIIFSVNPICGPFVSMFTLGPFKRELKRRFGCISRSISVSATIETAGNVVVASNQTTAIM